MPGKRLRRLRAKSEFVVFQRFPATTDGAPWLLGNDLLREVEGGRDGEWMVRA